MIRGRGGRERHSRSQHEEVLGLNPALGSIFLLFHFSVLSCKYFADRVVDKKLGEQARNACAHSKCVNWVNICMSHRYAPKNAMTICRWQWPFPMKKLAYLHQKGEMKEEKNRRWSRFRVSDAGPYHPAHIFYCSILSLKEVETLFIGEDFKGNEDFSINKPCYCAMWEIKKEKLIKRAPPGGANIKKNILMRKQTW